MWRATVSNIAKFVAYLSKGQRPKSRNRLMYDVCIIGAGHNGLVAAGYLAQYGLSVLVLEKQPHIGGLSASTKMLASHGSVSIGAVWSGMFQPDIERDLRISVVSTAMNPQVVYHSTSGDWHLDFLYPHQSAAWNAAYYGRRSGDRLYEAWQQWGRQQERAKSAISPILRALSARQRLAMFTQLSEDAQRFLLGSANELLEQYDNLSDAARCAIVHGSIAVHNQSPWTVSGGFSLAYMAASHTNGVRGTWGIPKGGMGQISELLASKLAEMKVEIRTSAEVLRVEQGDNRWLLRLKDGQLIVSRRVIGSLPITIFAEIVEGRLTHDAIPPGMPGCSALLHLRLDAAPELNRDVATWLQGVDAPTFFASGPKSLGELDTRVKDFYSSGRSFSEPLLLSATIDRNGSDHLLYVYAQFVRPDCDREALAQQCLLQLGGIMPRLANHALEIKVTTGLDIERQLGVPGGHPENYQTTARRFLACTMAAPRLSLAGSLLASRGGMLPRL
jgi:phytoene dehydrogenase-like protein